MRNGIVGMIKMFFPALLIMLLASSSFAALKPGDAAPIFSLRDSEGKDFYLNDEVGAAKKGNSKGVILSFFASWCVPCRQELPIIDALADELTAKGVRVVIVGFKEDFDRINELLKELKITKPLVLCDRYGKVGEKYSVRFLPTTFFIGADGKIKDVIFGGIKDAAELKASAGKLMQ
jgi:thiol-disulfide isomerase/thioredoxin